MNTSSVSAPNFTGNIIYISNNNDRIGTYIPKIIGQKNQQKLYEMVKYEPFNLFIRSNKNQKDTFEIVPATSFQKAASDKTEHITLKKENLHNIINFAKEAIEKYKIKK